MVESRWQFGGCQRLPGTMRGGTRRLWASKRPAQGALAGLGDRRLGGPRCGLRGALIPASFLFQPGIAAQHRHFPPPPLRGHLTGIAGFWLESRSVRRFLWAVSHPERLLSRGLWPFTGNPEHFSRWPHHCRPSLIHSLRSVRETLLIVTIHALINRVGTQPIKQASVIQGIALVKVQEEMLGFRIASR